MTVDYFFKLHFYNFDADLAECLAHLRTWTDRDTEEFLLDLKEHGANFFRIPKGYSEPNYKEVSASQNLEELNQMNAQNQEKEGMQVAFFMLSRSRKVFSIARSNQCSV